MKPAKRVSPPAKKHPPGSFMYKVRKRRILETLAAFIGGGWLTWEAVHWILVEHYYFPEKLLDITLVTLIGALLCTLTWRWFRSEKKTRKRIIEFIVIPVVILLTVFFDVKLFMSMKGQEGVESSTPKWENSIAVLPLENLSLARDQEYFSDGMTDAIIAELSKIEALRVISRTSVMQYKKTQKPLPEIARELNVETVVEGSVLHAEGKVRITVQLIKAREDQHLWAESYERDLSGILVLQSEVAQAIAREIKVTVTSEEEPRLSSSRPVDPEAHQEYLMGLFHSKNKTEEGLRTSLAHFKKAIKIDPTYASAHSQLAYTYNELGNFDILPSKEVYPKAKAAAKKALELEENLGEAHASLAWAKMVYDWDWAAAEGGYKKALKINPNSSLILEWYAEYLLIQGRFDEAVARAKQAEKLDPFSLATLRHLGEIYLMTGQYDRAIEQLQKTLEMAPDYFVAHRDLARAYAMMGKESAATEELQNMMSLLGDDQSDNMYRAFLYLMTELVAGRTNEVQRILEELEKPSKLSPDLMVTLAGVHATIGQKDKAFEFLEKAYEERDHSLIWIKVDPAFDGLRSDPRFTSLLNRIGLKN